jgi:aspartate racemase
MRNLKKIGIIGGADPAASCLLYQKIIDECLLRNDCNNGSDFPEIIIINYPFTRGMSASSAHATKNILIDELQKCVDKLVLCDVDIIALACNTLHFFVSHLRFHDKKFVSIITATCDAISKVPRTKTLLLATETTIKAHLYQQKKHNLIIPTAKHQKTIDYIITQIHTGSITQKDAMSITSIIQATCCDSILLACTDLPVLHHKYPITHEPIVTFDTVHILAQKLVKLVFERK